jgi:hypothetical protein
MPFRMSTSTIRSPSPECSQPGSQGLPLFGSGRHVAHSVSAPLSLRDQVVQCAPDAEDDEAQPDHDCGSCTNRHHARRDHGIDGCDDVVHGCLLLASCPRMKGSKTCWASCPCDFSRSCCDRHSGPQEVAASGRSIALRRGLALLLASSAILRCSSSAKSSPKRTSLRLFAITKT